MARLRRGRSPPSADDEEEKEDEGEKEEGKDEATDNYIHRGIAQRAFSKMFRLAEYMKVDDAQFVDGILTVFLYREIPEADKSRQITINTKAKSLPKAASA